MQIKILKIEPIGSGGNKITASLKGETLVLTDPQDNADASLLKKEIDAKICALHGKARRSPGPARFGSKTVTAKVLEKDYDYCVLDCGLFIFDYMMNIGEEDEFEVGQYVTLEGPRLDLML